MGKAPVIAVDGPSGTGKGTLCSYLASWLHWHFLDSGALYRVTAYAALKQDIDMNDVPGLAQLAAELPVNFDYDGEQVRVNLTGHGDISEHLRTENCGNAASKVAAMPEVRQALLERQRDFRQLPGLVADGRDMGTVVFPDAELKIFLTASPEERAKRRYKQLKAKGIGVTLQRLSADISERDARDQGRAASPLKPAADAIVIDSTNFDVSEVCQQVVLLVRERFPDYPEPSMD